MPRYRHRPIVSALVCAVAGAAVLTAPAGAGTSASRDPGRVTIVASKRVAALVDEMTLGEKLRMVSAKPDPATLGEAGYVPGVPRLGIPELRLADGPAGVRLNAHATAMPAPIALASTFDPSLAAEYGRTMGRDGRALGVDVLLAPMTNIIRVPQAGRNFETLSEDPYLSSRMAAAEVRGIQGEGLIATVKHFAENNQEASRETVNVTVDEQTLHEVELPAFDAAVRAGVGSVMCSYNLVHGAHACGSSALLNGILKTQLGFRGWVMSDWGATHATTDLVAGLDQNMFSIPGVGSPYFEKALKDAIRSGDIPMSALDDAVARILGQMERFGLLDGAADQRPTRDPEASAAAAQRIAEQGAVLLKNDDRALPLDAGDTSLALIGAGVKTPKVGGGGSSSVIPESAAAPWDAIRARAAGADVEYALRTDVTGVAIPLADSPFDENGEVTLSPGGALLQYTGTLSVPEAGDYTFSVNAPGSFGSVTVDGQQVLRNAFASTSASVSLAAGTHKIQLFGYPLQGVPETLSFRWVTPAAAAEVRAHAAEVAASVETPIVFVHDEGVEGMDRASLSLPFGQDQLVAAVAAANPRTIVVLDTGSSITMPWLDDVRAVLDMYYPGQNGAEATTRLLFGDVNPSGKLTQTFPASDAETPVAGDPESYPGVDDEETYKEAIQVGYKWYDEHGVTPLFPFGYGLSYTSFGYSDLAARQHGSRVQVTFTVTNTGDREGAEAAQVYVGPSPRLTLPQVQKKLVGFAKVALQPGESRVVTIDVPRRQLSSWDAKRDRWVLGTGPRSFAVGGSSASLPLDRSVQVKAG